jgi:hypothetical protein
MAAMEEELEASAMAAMEEEASLEEDLEASEASVEAGFTRSV